MLVLSTVVVLTLDFRTGVLDGVAGAANEVFGVFQSGLRLLVRPVEAIAQGIGDLGSLRNENERLTAENERLREEVLTFGDLARENGRIRALLQLEDSSGLETVHARVVGASLSGLERSVTINKGRNAGIVPDDPVLSGEGLVGRVSWAGATTARVLLLTDAQSAVGVRITSSGETGLVRGTGERHLELELVSRSALDQGAVKAGDVVVTSGFQDGLFPPGLPVGRVERVTLAPRGTSYTIQVRPFVRFSQLDILGIAVGHAEVVEAPTPSPEP